ncbi:MAG: transcription elongation factor GreA [Chloroflexi bacterium]|nr:transcription elongation factor GreA [Chloroflexota bacterium]
MADRTVYLTREGFRRLDEELEQLRTVKRPEVSERIRRSKDMTDVTDNAEYDEAKSEQAFVEGRIAELEVTLASAQIIEETGSTEFVGLGSRVKVRDDDGEEDDYRIVGSMEADPKRGMISNESPVGRALLGKKPGESATVVAPGGSFNLTVVTIG